MDSGTSKKACLAISLGDYNGIGPEIIIKTFSDNRILKYVVPVIFGSTRVLSHYKKLLNARQFNYSSLVDLNRINPKTINVVNCWDDDIRIEAGKGTKKSGECAVKAFKAATDAVLEFNLQGLVTAPVSKLNIQSDTWQFPGHTDYLSQHFDSKGHLMFMVGEKLKIGLVTDHLPVSQIASHITAEAITDKLKIMNQSLKTDFGINRPRIAVLGLNPHAGDNGVIGSEDVEIIKPAIDRAAENKMMVFGPYAADGFFGNGHYAQFDAVLAMYHDQGLIPFKTLEFGNGVNFTAGLPIVRTSPDHGTAFDIAGSGNASPDSFRKSIFTCLDIARQRSARD